MGSYRVHFFALALGVVGIVGCGSSGSGGTTGGGGGGNPTTVTFTFKGAAPTAVAAKIGSGAFAVETVNSGAVSLSIPDGTTQFALAYVCPPVPVTSGGSQIGQNTNEAIVEASTADGTSFTLTCATAPDSAKTGTLTGSVDASAITGANYTAVVADNGSFGEESYNSGATSNFSLTMPAGTDRVGVAGYVYTSGPFGANSVWTLAALRNFDGVTVPGSVNGGATVAMGAADAVIQEPITYKNVPTDYKAPSTFAAYIWTGGGGLQLSNGATSEYPSVPTAAAESGDSYLFSATAMSGTGAGVVSISTAAAAGPMTFTFPAPWSYGGPTPAALPTFNFNYSGFSGKTGVANTALIGWSPKSNSANLIEMIASGNYLSGSTAISIPDLSNVAGFLVAPASGAQVFWGADVMQSSAGFLQATSGSRDAVGVETAGAYKVP